MADELRNGQILKAFKTWGKMFTGITKMFVPFFMTFLVISLLGWIYGTIYTKFGIEKVIVSGVVMVIYYLGKIYGEVKKIGNKSN